MEELSQAGFILLHINPWLQFRGTLLTIVVSWDLTKQTKRERKRPHRQNMWYDRTHHTPQLHTHTHTSISTHTSTHSSWWEGRLSDMATVRKVNLGRWACPMPWLILGFPHPLMQGSGLCSHTFISGTDRIGLCLAPHHTWSNVILIHTYIYYTITVFRFILFHSNSK